MLKIKFSIYGELTHEMTLNSHGRKGGRAALSYTFGPMDNPTLFTGDDFFPSPLHSPESAESAIGLLGFLTLAPGDTDEGHFDDYTADQLSFASSAKDSDLSLLVYEFENENFDAIEIYFDHGDMTISLIFEEDGHA